MSTIIRLQNHGFKNHPYWYVVVAPKYSKLSGKYLEQLGYWIPRKGKTFDRQIILNKKRIQYWIAMGAEPTPKVAKFLNLVDAWPKPVIKYGSKSIYEKPERITKDSQSLNPYSRKQMQHFLKNILDQEESSLLFRYAIQNQNYLQHYQNNSDLSYLSSDLNNQVENSGDPAKIQSEIEQLKQKLNEINGDLTKLDQNRQNLIVNRINDLYKVWSREQILAEFNQQNLQSNKFNEATNAKNIKPRMDQNLIQKKMHDFENLVAEHQQMMKPITRDEFKTYLMVEGKFSDIKAETLTRQAFRNSREQGMQVLRQHAYELIQPKIQFQNVEELLQKKTMKYEDKTFVPISKPVTPLPDLSSYDPEDYYEIPKMVDPYASQNKPYDLPNINDVHIPVKEVKVRNTPRNVNGRKQPPRLKARAFNHHMYEVFSTFTNKRNSVQRKDMFKGLHVPAYYYYDLQNIDQL